MRLPASCSYKCWLEQGGNSQRYKQVREIRKFVASVDDKLFRKAVIHGSVATLDDTVGFSDLDLSFIVCASALKDASKLCKLRRQAAEILVLTYSFDPFMHHGPYYIAETDFAWYPEAMFPTVLYRYAVDLIDDPDELCFSIRPSSSVTLQMLNMFEEFFKRWPSKPLVIHDSFELEWILGSTLLLPALYLQQKTGEFRYKRDSFQMAEEDFSEKEWEPVRIATYLRSNLALRPKLPRCLIYLARYLRWPGLLQTLARRHPESVRRAEESVDMLGPDYPVRVIHLINVMKKILKNDREDSKP